MKGLGLTVLHPFRQTDEQHLHMRFTCVKGFRPKEPILLVRLETLLVTDFK